LNTVTAKPKGRLVEHDPASRNHPARRASMPPDRAILWSHRAPVHRQRLGACVAHSTEQLFNTAPYAALRAKRNRRRYYTEADAEAFYAEVTAADTFPGAYPPDDTGTSALSAAKVLKADGIIGRYEWAFGLAHLRRWLPFGPAMLGVWWREAMDYPGPGAIVRYEGDDVEGHEFVCLGYNPRAKGREFTMLNSWGASFGERGRFYMAEGQVDAMLDNEGDVLVIPPDAVIL
jgi:hypothetical protein